MMTETSYKTTNEYAKETLKSDGGNGFGKLGTGGVRAAAKSLQGAGRQRLRNKRMKLNSKEGPQ